MGQSSIVAQSPWEIVGIRSLFSFGFVTWAVTGEVFSFGEHLDESSTFYMMQKADGVVVFKCVKNDKKFLRVNGNWVDSDGAGGPLCDFRVVTNDDETVSLRSVKFPDTLVAVDQEGRVIATKVDHHHYSRKFVLART